MALRPQLIGVWSLVSYELLAADGSQRVEPMGADPQGFIIYTEEGYMSAQLMRPGRASFGSGNGLGGAAAEYGVGSAGYISYGGPFHVDEAESTVAHSVTVSLFPDWIGGTQKRGVIIRGDQLTLSSLNTISIEGRDSTARIVWRRAAPAS